MVGRYFLVASAVVIILIVGVNAYFYLQYSSPQFFVTFGNDNRLITMTTTTASAGVQHKDTTCNNNSDCAWVITNCCTENAGGNWECINQMTFTAGCPETVLCPQYISHKPSSSCSCNQGSCRSQ